MSASREQAAAARMVRAAAGSGGVEQHLPVGTIAVEFDGRLRDLRQSPDDFKRRSFKPEGLALGCWQSGMGSDPAAAPSHCSGSTARTFALLTP